VKSYEGKGKCWRCGYNLGQTDYLYESNCSGCRTATRVCRNCRFFSNSAPNKCSESQAKLIV